MRKKKGTVLITMVVVKKAVIMTIIVIIVIKLNMLYVICLCNCWLKNKKGYNKTESKNIALDQ